MTHLICTVTWAAILLHGLERCEGQRAEDVVWENSPDQAINSALQSGRPLLIYVVTDACSYCRKMEAQTWSDRLVREQVAAQYVPLKIDAQRHTELSQRLGVRAFPTMLVVAPSGHLVSRLEGFVDARKMLGSLQKASLASTALAVPGNSKKRR